MKRVLVVFDTKYGNTEKLAREVAKGIQESGIETEVVNIGDLEQQDITMYDGFLFGAPIHAFRATRGIIGAVKKVAKTGLDGKLVGAFDTYASPGHKSKCAKQIEKELSKRAKGSRVFSKHMSALVDGYEGPLNDAEPAKAREFGQEFSKELAKENIGSD